MCSAATEEASQPVTCWVCDASNVSRWKDRSIQRRLLPDDLRITDSRYGVTLGLWKCAECGFIFADGAELAELTSLYERLVDPDYETSQEARALQMRWLLDAAVATYPHAKSLLDVGAGTGLLVAEAARRGLDAVGVEPSSALVQSGRRSNTPNLLHGIFPHPALRERSFDLIFVVDVLEHVSQPVQLLRDCARALKPAGLLVIVTPDAGSVAARLLRSHWWHFRLAHVGYFQRQALQRAATAAGLSITREFRAKWFLPISYLADRLAVYLPLGWFNRAILHRRALRWLYRRAISINLHDSFVLFLKRVDGRSS